MRERLARRVVGRRRFQPLFERLYHFALDGMNIGPAWNAETSGEAHVIRRLPSNATVLDVGANVGSYSQLVLRTSPNAVIHSFEPDPTAFAELSRIRGICAHNVALGAETGVVGLFQPDQGSPLSSRYARRHPRIAWSSSIEVRSERLDDVCNRESINHIDLLKIDVEGHELAVIEGAAQQIAAGAIDRIQFEFGGSNVDSRTYLRDFIEALPGYRIDRIVRDGVVPVAYSERSELFDTTNFLATRK